MGGYGQDLSAYGSGRVNGCYEEDYDRLFSIKFGKS
jgi:hypothetical protein